MNTSPATPLRIDFVSDVSCPWCAIGLAGLEQALERVKPDGIQAEVRFQPFELNPQMAPEGEDVGGVVGQGKLVTKPGRLGAGEEFLRERWPIVGEERLGAQHSDLCARAAPPQCGDECRRGESAAHDQNPHLMRLRHPEESEAPPKALREKDLERTAF